jgi:LPXTG-site transpeptidase (sortase) family protein
MDYGKYPDYSRYEELGYGGPPTGKRRLYLILAFVWLLVGGGLLAFAGYQLMSPSDAGESWIYARPNFEADGSVAVAGEAGVPVAPALGDQPYRLVIDKIGVDAPVAAYGLNADAVPEVPYEGGLVAWYTFSSPPGGGDNAVFAGHVTWNGDAIFRHLGDLTVGDSIFIRSEDGGELIYEVSETTLVDPTSQAARQWMDPNGQNVITLITCGGERYETNDFFGAAYTQRQIVRAVLVGGI